MRVASIDIGTNTILLLVAEMKSGTLSAVREEATIVRLGEGVDKTRTLKPEAIARARACLERYAEIVRALDVKKIGVVGTSAMRDAGGGEEVRALVKSLFGVEARTISGEEEAQLTFRGGMSGLPWKGTMAAVFDVGGGSTEIVCGTQNEILIAQSFDIGSVRLTERHFTSDPPSTREVDALRADAKKTLESISLRFEGDLVGIAGTVTTLAAIDLGMDPYDGAAVHGKVMTRDALEAIVEKLRVLPLEARKAVPGLEPKRADVIVAGGLIALAAMDQLGAREMRVSDRGVRWGVAESLLGP